MQKLVSRAENRGHGVSVIIPCFNDGRYLKEAVASVFAQATSLPFEILIINDGSTDEATLSAIKDVEEGHENIRVFHQPENRGASAARNVGLIHASYDYVFPLDVDNMVGHAEIGKGYVDLSVNALQQNPNVVLTHCKGHYFGARSGPCELLSFNEKTLLVKNMIDTRSMYRTHEALEVGGYNESIATAEDWDFAIAMINRRRKAGLGTDVAEFEGPLFLYRVRGDFSNLSARHSRHDTRSLLASLVDRNPEIYQSYYPGKSRHEILDSVMLERQFIRLKQAISDGLHIAFNVRAWPEMWGYVRQKISKEFGRSSGAPEKAHESVRVGLKHQTLE